MDSVNKVIAAILEADTLETAPVITGGSTEVKVTGGKSPRSRRASSPRPSSPARREERGYGVLGMIRRNIKTLRGGEIEVEGGKRRSKRRSPKRSRRRMRGGEEPVVADVSGGSVQVAVGAPAIDAPTIDAPAIDAPAIDAPAIDAPAIVAIDATQVEGGKRRRSRRRSVRGGEETAAVEGGKRRSKRRSRRSVRGGEETAAVEGGKRRRSRRSVRGGEESITGGQAIPVTAVAVVEAVTTAVTTAVTEVPLTGGRHKRGVHVSPRDMPPEMREQRSKTVARYKQLLEMHKGVPGNELLKFAMQTKRPLSSFKRS